MQHPEQYTLYFNTTVCVCMIKKYFGGSVYHMNDCGYCIKSHTDSSNKMTLQMGQRRLRLTIDNGKTETFTKFYCCVFYQQEIRRHVVGQQDIVHHSAGNYTKK